MIKNIIMLYQVNRFLFKRNFVSQFLRYAHEQRSSNVLYPLESRKLLRITGNDAEVFLQGLITNDMRHFEDHAGKSIYAMFLNNKGRVLYDTLIHQSANEDSYLIECDKNVISLLLKHLKLYKLKRFVDFSDVSQNFKLWAFIPGSIASSEYKIDSNNKINIFKDPRISDLGYRVLTSASTKHQEMLDVIGKDVEIKNNEDGYKYLRYKLGVSEGAEDLPPGSSFPLEANCDYLHGVSFHKGCYIGQELTARVHHTGVVRKRIMPLKFIDEVTETLEKESVISASDNPKSNVGKLKCRIQDYGLGLVRIKEAFDAKELNIGKYSVEVLKPSWWPIEASKEKATVAKVE